MEKAIINIINDKAVKQLLKLAPGKRRIYRAMLYSGVQITENERSVKSIAEELCISEDRISNLVEQWINLVHSGDVTVNLIITAIHKLPNEIRFHKEKKNDLKILKSDSETEFTNDQNEDPPEIKEVKHKNKNILGFIVTPEDELRKRATIRSSILFFQTYGKGTRPRMHGEYYTPGTHQAKNDNDSNKWLSLETAALYCGCNEEIINKAGQNGVIERRVYKRNANRNYYEYNITDLNKFICDNHML